MQPGGGVKPAVQQEHTARVCHSPLGGQRHILALNAGQGDTPDVAAVLELAVGGQHLVSWPARHRRPCGCCRHPSVATSCCLRGSAA